MEYPMEYRNIPWKIVWNIVWNIEMFNAKSYGTSYGISYGISKYSNGISENCKIVSSALAAEFNSLFFDSFPPTAVIGGLSAPCTSADPLDSTPSCLVPTRVQKIEKTAQTPSQLKSIKILGKSQKSN